MKNHYWQTLHELKLEGACNKNPLAQKAFALEIVFMVEHNRIGGQWDYFSAHIVNRWYNGWEDFATKDADFLEACLEPFEKYCIGKIGDNPYNLYEYK
jgi:hypothetical protein